MKKLFLAMLIIMLIPAVNATALNWIGVNQVTVAWDAVTALGDDTPIPQGDAISYRIYIKKLPSGADQVIGDTQQLTYTITLPSEGRYVVGLQTVRIPQGETEEQLSEINWSDVNGESTPNPFGIKYFINPSAAKNLRPQ